MKIMNLSELFLYQLRDLYSAESQIIVALPTMINAVRDSKLKEALTDHLAVTKEQRARLDSIGEELNFKVMAHTCQGIKGVLAEGTETIEMVVDPATRDAAIIISAQRVEHYEIAAYGGAISFARDLGYIDAADLLQETLNEEGEADEKLSELAEGGFFSEGINEAAMEVAE